MERWVGAVHEPDRYLLVHPHSRGGEGELWRAELRLGSVPIAVAVKIGHLSSQMPVSDAPQPTLTPTPSSPSLQQWRAARRWEQQTELLRTLSHPHLVRVREVFEGPGPHPQGDPLADSEPYLYLVMNWVEGATTSQWVQNARPTPARTVMMLAGIASALDYLHAGQDTAGIPVLHRDVKPANILVTGDSATLVDFGLARLLDPEGTTMTMAGTPAFLSPEAITDQHFSPASDRYAFAGTLYRLITGCRPNVFEPERMRTAVRQIRAEPTDRLADLLIAGMHTDPAQRPTNLSGWVEDLIASLPKAADDDLRSAAAPVSTPWRPPKRPAADTPASSRVGDEESDRHDADDTVVRGNADDRDPDQRNDDAEVGTTSADGATTLGGGPSRRNRRRAIVALVAATLALLSVAGVLLALLPRTDPPAAVQATATDAERWQRIAHEPTVFGGQGEQAMRSVTAGGPGLVAVGYDTGLAAAAVWTSQDGRNWQRISHDAAVFGGQGEQAMRSVTVGGPGLVAVGDGGDGVVGVWVSEDGTDWHRVAHDQAAFGGNGEQAMISVTAGGPGLVAVGRDGPIGSSSAAVWTSQDGLSWQRTADDPTVFGDGDGQVMISVTAGGPGLVAVGRDGPRESSSAAVWTSTDGLSWQRIAPDPPVFGEGEGQVMNAVTAGGPGLVAVGEAGARDAVAVWTSADATSWQRVPHDPAVFGGGGEQDMTAVTTGGPGLVAVGYEGETGASSAAVWTSEDGLSWHRIVHDPAVFGASGRQAMRTVTVGGPGLVAVGHDRDRDAAAAWTSP